MRKGAGKKPGIVPLRRRAEDRLKEKKPEAGLVPDGTDQKKLIHELQVHQIELEMQNDELNRAREEVEEVLAKYTDLYDFAPVGYFTFDEKGLISELNLTAARLLGIERSFLFNKPFSSFIQRGFQDRFYLHLQEVLESPAKQTCELVLKKKDGATSDAQLESISIQAKGYRLVHSVLTDISMRKQAEETIQRFASFPQLNPHPVLETDLSGTLLFSNPATLKILEELALQKEDTGLFLPEDLDAILRDWDKKTSVTLFREVIVKNRIFGETVQLAPEFMAARIYAHEITIRKQAEWELSAIYQRLQALMKALPVGVSFSDDQTCERITGNPAALAQFEVGLNDNLSASAPDPNTPGRQVRFFREGRQIRDAELPLQRAVAENREIPPMELEVILPSGRRWFADASGAPIWNKEGNVIGGVAVTVDITKHRQAQDRIANLTRLYAVLSRINELIVRKNDEESLLSEICRIVAEEGKFLLVWIGMVKEQDIVPVASCGLATDYLKGIKVAVNGKLGKGPTGTCIREDRPVVNVDFETSRSMSPWREAAARYGFRSSAAFPLHRQGKAVGAFAIYASVSNAFDAEQVGLLESLSADISYALDALDLEQLRVQYEEDLLQAKEEWERTFAGVPDLIAILDNDHRVVRVNEAMARSLGVKAEKCIGLPCYEVVHGLPEPPDFCPHTRTLKDFCEHTEQFREKRLGLDFEVTTTPIYDHQGNMTGSVHVAHNITERKRAEEALEASRNELEERVQQRTEELSDAYEELQAEVEKHKKTEEQLRQAHKMEAIGTLAGGIAHDFNNILAAIMGFTEMVIEDLPEGCQEEKNLHHVLKSAHRGRDLVRQILAFSRKSDYVRGSMSLTPLITETIQLLRASIPSTVKIVFKTATTLDTVLASPTEIQQMLMNLATNAALAMQDTGGTLEICLNNIDFQPETSAFDLDIASGEYIQLAVRDTGTGMTPEVMKRIFEPFFTTREVGKGTGLGLAVVYGIVTDLNGAITIESEPGVGSIFRVFLPKTKPEVITDQEKVNDSPRGKERVLFIDDEELLVEWGHAALTRLGYEVTSMTDSMGALKAFSADPAQFDLVVTDQTMPGLTGMQLVEKLLKIRPDMPIILFTGHSETITPEEVQAAGIGEFLMKPFGKQELAVSIRRVLDNKR